MSNIDLPEKENIMSISSPIGSASRKQLIDKYLEVRRLTQSICIPLEIEDFIEFLKQNKMPIPAVFQEKNKRVLIVDDDDAMAKAIRRVLKRKGYETLIAPDGFSAGAMLGTFIPHVVTLDLSMPGISGREVLDFIKQCDILHETRVLVVSALDLSDLEAAVEAGADDLLQKPFDNNILLEKISKLMY